MLDTEINKRKPFEITSPSLETLSLDTSSSTEDNNKKIIISNLPLDLTDRDFYSLLTSMSIEPESSNLLINHKNRTKIAFVVYPTEEDAQLAISEMNCIELRGHEIMIRLASDGIKGEPNANIIIKGIISEIRARNLFDILLIFGKIISVKVPVSKSNIRLNYGFVQFKETESAKKAIHFLNTVKVRNVQLQAEVFMDAEERHKIKNSKEFVLKYVLKSIDKTELENDLNEIASGLKFCLDKTGKELYIVFGKLKEESNKNELISAIDRWNQKYPNSTQIVFESVMPKLFLAKTRSEQSKQKWGFFRKRNVFLKGIPKEYGKKEILELCERYGSVESTFISRSIRDPVNEQNAGWAYALYEKEEDAAKAIGELNGMFVGINTLNASYALPPEARKEKKIVSIRFIRKEMIIMDIRER